MMVMACRLEYTIKVQVSSLNCRRVILLNLTSGNENHLCWVSLRESHKIESTKAWRMGPKVCPSVEANNKSEKYHRLLVVQ